MNISSLVVDRTLISSVDCTRFQSFASSPLGWTTTIKEFNRKCNISGKWGFRESVNYIDSRIRWVFGNTIAILKKIQWTKAEGAWSPNEGEV